MTFEKQRVSRNSVLLPFSLSSILCSFSCTSLPVTLRDITHSLREDSPYFCFWFTGCGRAPSDLPPSLRFPQQSVKRQPSYQRQNPCLLLDALAAVPAAVLVLPPQPEQKSSTLQHQPPALPAGNGSPMHRTEMRVIISSSSRSTTLHSQGWSNTDCWSNFLYYSR